MTKTIRRKTPLNVGISRNIGTLGPVPFSVKNTPLSQPIQKTPKENVKQFVIPRTKPNNIKPVVVQSEKIKSMEELLEEAEKFSKLDKIELIQPASVITTDQKIKSSAKPIIVPVNSNLPAVKYRPPVKLEKYDTNVEDEMCSYIDNADVLPFLQVMVIK